MTNDSDYITYTIEVTNYSTVDVRVNDIEITKTNNNMKVSKMGITNGDIILAGGTKTFTVKVKLTDATSTEQTGTVTISPKVTRLKGGLGSVVEETYTAYNIGDVVQFAGSNWYVIEDSGTSQDYVTLLKEIVLTNSELGSYATMNTSGYMSYYYDDNCHSSDTYGYTNTVTSGCSGHNDYEGSKVKELFESTYINTLGSFNLKEVNGYKIRLITTDELINNLGWRSGLDTKATTEGNNVPIWVYQNFGGNYYYTMTPNPNLSSHVLRVASGSGLGSDNVASNYRSVRPVINLYKAAID